MPRRSAPPWPTVLQTAILRRAAAGSVLCTMVDGAPTYTYEDGTPVSGSAKDVQKCIANGWLSGDRDALSADAPSQVYRVLCGRLST